jgi:hypothetical protein
LRRGFHFAGGLYAAGTKSPPLPLMARNSHSAADALRGILESHMASLGSLITGGILVVLSLDYLAPPIGTGVDMKMWPTVMSPTAVSMQSVPDMQVVDRTNKGDKLMVVPMTTGTYRPAVTVEKQSPVRTRSENPKIPIGCDLAFSTLLVSKENNIAGRCLADAGSGPRLATLIR